jgi:hypothetical protein
MAYQVRNIIVGAAALYLGAADSTQNNYVAPTLPTVPAAPATQATALEASTAWRHAGYTSEGLELAYEPDYSDVEVDQLLDAAKIFKSGMRVSLNTTLVEASLENLLIAWGLAGGTGGALASTATEETLSIGAGALGDEPVERSLAAVGPGPRSGAGARRERVYLARRVISVEASSLALRRTEATTFPVSFRLLPDPAFAKSEYGLIRDRVL